MKKTKAKSRIVKPGGAAEYIAASPKVAQQSLKALRSAIREVAPDAIETVSYFDMPGYCYEGYAYNGMFAWFSFKDSAVRLHVRPQAIVNYKNELARYATTRAIVSFPIDRTIPKSLIKKIVKASLKDMKDAGQNLGSS